MDFQIKRPTRRCHESGREFSPGEEYISELIPDDPQTGSPFQRRDYSLDKWPGPSEATIGWWRARVPVRDEGRVYWAPDDVLYEYFDQLLQQPDNTERAFVMAMLLVRKKLARLEDETGREDGQRVLVLTLPNDKSSREVVVADIDPATGQMIQDEFADHLFTDQPPG